jgi:hypothetical protein
MACSKAEKASWTTEARTPPAPVSDAPRPGPDKRAARAAWQTGHHWHSSGSSGGSSVVAVSHTSPLSRRFSWPIVLLDLVGDLVSHAARARFHQPALEIGQGVVALDGATDR